MTASDNKPLSKEDLEVRYFNLQRIYHKLADLAIRLGEALEDPPIKKLEGTGMTSLCPLDCVRAAHQEIIERKATKTSKPEEAPKKTWACPECKEPQEVKRICPDCLTMMEPLDVEEEEEDDEDLYLDWIDGEEYDDEEV